VHRCNGDEALLGENFLEMVLILSGFIFLFCELCWNYNGENHMTRLFGDAKFSFMNIEKLHSKDFFNEILGHVLGVDLLNFSFVKP